MYGIICEMTDEEMASIEELINKLIDFSEEIHNGVPEDFYTNPKITDMNMSDSALRESLQYYELLLSKLKIFDIQSYQKLDSKIFGLCKKWYDNMVGEVECYVEQDKLILEPNGNNTLLQTEKLILKMREYESGMRDAINELERISSE